MGLIVAVAAGLQQQWQHHRGRVPESGCDRSRVTCIWIWVRSASECGLDQNLGLALIWIWSGPESETNWYWSLIPIWIWSRSAGAKGARSISLDLERMLSRREDHGGTLTTPVTGCRLRCI